MCHFAGLRSLGNAGSNCSRFQQPSQPTVPVRQAYCVRLHLYLAGAETDAICAPRRFVRNKRCRRAPARCAYHSQVESLVVLPSLSRCPRRRQRKQQGVGGPH